MKIECPECGQHYEVDASMLDKHFRCTECKAFFLGINAKAVKVKKFVPKNLTEGQGDAVAGDVAEGNAAEEKNAAADVAEAAAEKNNAVGDITAKEEKTSDVVKLDPAKFEENSFPNDADSNVIDERHSKIKLVIIALAAGLILFTAIIAGIVSWGVGANNAAEVEALTKRLLQENNALQQERIEKLEAVDASADAKIAAANEKSAKLEQKIAAVENNLKKINELAEAVNKLESKDLELNVKILELNSVVNDLNNLIDSSERNGSRVQRRRR